MSIRKSSHYICAISLIIVATNVILVTKHLNHKSYVIIIWQPLTRNISCHYSTTEDALPSAESDSFAPDKNSIFFHETSCRGGLNSRQACAIESAARAHSNRQIYVLFSGPVTKYVYQRSVLAKLQDLGNVNLARVHITEYSRGIYSKETLQQIRSSEFAVIHTSDMLRIVTLRKWGGVYMDTDVVVMKSLDDLPPNWAVQESPEAFSNGVLALSNDKIGRNISDMLLNTMSELYDPDSRVGNGPEVIDVLLEELCGRNITRPGDYCKGIYVLGYESFYPIYYDVAHKYFNPATVNITEGPYMHHLWNDITWNYRVHERSLYAQLARRYCPSVFEMYGAQFGL